MTLKTLAFLYNYDVFFNGTLRVKIIDGLVNGTARFIRGLGSLYSQKFHVGQTQAYALSIAIGSVLLVLLYAIG